MLLIKNILLWPTTTFGDAINHEIYGLFALIALGLTLILLVASIVRHVKGYPAYPLLLSIACAALFLPFAIAAARPDAARDIFTVIIPIHAIISLGIFSAYFVPQRKIFDIVWFIPITNTIGIWFLYVFASYFTET